tara:strand:- start:3855 stop:3974 length:120 start_codon:yes stop_codon:yes gene_type:complete
MMNAETARTIKMYNSDLFIVLNLGIDLVSGFDILGLLKI